MDLEPLPTLIAGAGMGGLALGHALAKANHPVILFEKDAATHSRAQGYRLHLDDEGVAALKECLTPETFELFLRLSEPLGQGFGFFDHRLRQLAYFRAPSKSARVIARSTFRKILLHTLRASVEFGRAARGFRLEGGSVEVDFEDGSAQRGGLLVGADGSASAIARQLVPAQPLSDTGVVIIIGKVPTTERVLQSMPRGRFERLGLVLGPDDVNLFLSQHLPGHGETGALDDVPHVRAWLDELPGYSVWALLLKTNRFTSEENPMTLPGEALKARALQSLHGWHPDMHHLISVSAPSHVTCKRIRSADHIGTWRTSSRVTVLGDAAALAALLRKQRFERAMVRRTRPVVRASRRTLNGSMRGAVTKKLFKTGLVALDAILRARRE
ncbi:FAD-dependent oxidoreductase [Archangium violaceum]|uniref:FAD-dependent oxidoreductase n=1 Tax=Archangium violaceum TaxID=83451 RepID=UPI00193C04B5|nr:NAD(P)-binding protein [Archangium violaceum]